MIIKGLEHFIQGEAERDWDCSAWRGEGLEGSCPRVKKLDGGSKDNKARLFTAVLRDRTRGHGTNWNTRNST